LENERTKQQQLMASSFKEEEEVNLTETLAAFVFFDSHIALLYWNAFLAACSSHHLSAHPHPSLSTPYRLLLLLLHEGGETDWRNIPHSRGGPFSWPPPPPHVLKRILGVVARETFCPAYLLPLPLTR
jgi:hypothetical protein